MSQEEKDAVLGKTMRQYVAEKAEAAAIAGKLRSLGDGLTGLGSLLQGLPRASSLAALAAWQQAKRSQMVDTDQIGALLDEYHTHQKEVADLKKQLAELGIPDPD